MEIGRKVSEFELFDHTGTKRSLSSFLADGPVVLFFYPAAMTKGCTAESCHFRDLSSEFGALGAQRVGISMDDVEKQKKFSDTYEFDFPLLSDPDGEVAKLFEVKRSVGLLKVKRHTFVIGEDFSILAEFKSEFNMNSHADEALSFLRSRMKNA